jgi:hypothetical protein
LVQDTKAARHFGNDDQLETARPVNRKKTGRGHVSINDTAQPSLRQI